MFGDRKASKAQLGRNLTKQSVLDIAGMQHIYKHIPPNLLRERL